MLKKLRELTGVGFKDCKIAIEENNGDLKICGIFKKKRYCKSLKEDAKKCIRGAYTIT